MDFFMEEDKNKILSSSKNIFFCFKCHKLLTEYEIDDSKRISVFVIPLKKYLCKECITPLVHFRKKNFKEKQLKLKEVIEK